MIDLKIMNAQINFFNKSGFNSVSNENVTHVKVLPYLSIVQSLEGSYDISIGNGKQMQTDEGGFFIAPAGVQQNIVHHVNKQSGKMTCRWIFIDIKINNVVSIDSLYQFPVVVKDEHKKELNILFDRLFATDDIWENYSDCYKLIGYLLQMATPIKNGMHKTIQQAITYIIEHYTEQITIKTLANLSFMSESNFYATFKKHVGASPIAYLNRYRLSVAVEKLAHTNKTINEISYSVGINNPLYFSKLFKKTYAMSPKEYRMVYQKNRMIQSM
jgi:AraC-like DNA-binding protein